MNESKNSIKLKITISNLYIRWSIIEYLKNISQLYELRLTRFDKYYEIKYFMIKYTYKLRFINVL